MAEGEEELKSLLMKVKEESEKVSLKLNLQKTKIMASGPILANRWGKSGNSDRFYFLGLLNHCRWLTALTKLNNASSLEEMPWLTWVSEVAQSCPTLCDPMFCSLPGSSIHGILQASILEWVAISSFRGSSQPRDWTQVCIAGRFFIISYKVVDLGFIPIAV